MNIEATLSGIIGVIVVVWFLSRIWFRGDVSEDDEDRRVEVLNALIAHDNMTRGLIGNADRETFQTKQFQNLLADRDRQAKALSDLLESLGGHRSV